jgi:phage baseplate assembly protein W
MNPTFGGGLRDFIFEQISNDNVANLQSQIQDQLNVFFPKVEVISLEVGSNPDDYTISVFLKYAVKNTNIIDNITIDFNK